jgi:hypothetical protein
MVRGLIQMYHHVNGDTSRVVHTPTVIDAKYLWRDFAKLKHWTLIEPVRAYRAHGSKSSGYYRITTNGVLFVENKLEVSKYIWLKGGKPTKYAQHCIDVVDALGTRFDYRSLFTL